MINLVGKGGMGEVFRVQDLTLDQEVALKFLPDDLEADPHGLALFHKEVRIARQVTHRNVCRMYDIGEVDGRYFLSMEYVKGEDLSSLLRRIGRLPEERGLEIARQLCAGLAAAHEQGVLHRDLKPANVMIDENGDVRISDFGLAGAVGEIDDVGSGTPGYMAPEQLKGEEVSVKSDIFSLGLILYELFTGRKVFDAKSLKGLLKEHSDSSIPSPSSTVRHLSHETERDPPMPRPRPGAPARFSADAVGHAAGRGSARRSTRLGPHPFARARCRCRRANSRSTQICTSLDSHRTRSTNGF